MCAVISLAFSNHINLLIGNILSTKMIATLTIVVISLINMSGIRESTTIINGMTIIEMSSLILLVFALPFIYNNKRMSTMPTFKQSMLVPLIMIFAFTGSEALPKLAGETIDVKHIPMAIEKSITVTTILYVLVAIVMISLNINSDTSMVSTYVSIFGSKSKSIISVIALFSIFNTIMTNNISSTRTLYGYGLSKNIKPLTYIGKNKTPILAIVIVGLLSITMLYMGNMENLAIFSNIFIMVTMMIINIVAYKEMNRYRNIISIICALMFILYGVKHLFFN